MKNNRLGIAWVLVILVMLPVLCLDTPKTGAQDKALSSLPTELSPEDNDLMYLVDTDLALAERSRQCTIATLKGTFGTAIATDLACTGCVDVTDIGADAVGTSEIINDSVALTTDTSGNYVASVAGDATITATTCTGEGSACALGVTAGSIGTNQLEDSSIREQDMSCGVDVPGAGECLTYVDANTFAWEPCGATGTFFDLTDVTETTYTGHGGYTVTVNVAETGLEFTSPLGGGDMSAAIWDGDSDGFIDQDAGGTDENISTYTGLLGTTTGTMSEVDTSAELLTMIPDGEGTGEVVFDDTPHLITPDIGAATGTSLTTTGNLVSSAGFLRPLVQAGTPATCTVGDLFFDTDEDTVGSLKMCYLTDTWKDVDDDAGGTPAWDTITSAVKDWTIDFAGYEQVLSTSVDESGGVGLEIRNTDNTILNSTALLYLTTYANDSPLFIPFSISDNVDVAAEPILSINYLGTISTIGGINTQANNVFGLVGGSSINWFNGVSHFDAGFTYFDDTATSNTYGGQLWIYEPSVIGSDYVRLRTHTSGSTTYTLMLPSTVPTGTQYLTGVISSGTEVQLAWAAGGTGGISSVGDCSTGACLDGTSDGGTYIRLHDSGSYYGEFQVPTLAANRTYNFPLIGPASDPSNVPIGDVRGPSVAVSTAVPKFSDTTGKLLSESGVLISDTTNNVSTPGSLSAGSGTFVATSAGDVTANSYTVTKDSGVAGRVLLYEETLLETKGVGWEGPTTRDTDLYLKLPYEDPAAGQSLVFGLPTGTDPKVSVGSWAYPVAISGTPGDENFCTYETDAPAGITCDITPATVYTVAGPTVVAVNDGGTGFDTYGTGDMLYASGATTLTKLVAAAAGNTLLSGAAPTWGKLPLTTHVTGTLPVENGGTELSSGTQGGIPYFSGAGGLAMTSSALLTQYGVMIGGGTGAPSTISVGATNTVLRGATGAAPAFGALVNADLPIVTPLKGGTGVNNPDTNTLTISGAGATTITKAANPLLINFTNFPNNVDTYVKPSNVTYIPITIGGVPVTAAQINAYITAATAGDTLVLSAGTYTITEAIVVSKALNIIGQGNAGVISIAETDLHGTRIRCTTNDITVFNITSSPGDVRIAHLSILHEGGGTAVKAVATANNLGGMTFTNMDVVMTGAGTKTAFDLLGTDAVLRDVTFTVTSSNSTAWGVYAHNTSATTGDKIVDIHTTNGTTTGGATNSIPFYVYNDNDANTVTMNLWNSWGKSTNATANDYGAYCNSLTTFNAKLNVYNSTLSGGTTGTNDVDLGNTSTNVATIYGGVLVNSTTSGTITYAGTMGIASLVGMTDVRFGADPADAGQIRLSNTNTIAWEKAVAGTDTTLGLNATDDMTLALVATDDKFNVTTGNVTIGAGSPTQTLNGADLYTSGFAEVDGIVYADGGVNTTTVTLAKVDGVPGVSCVYDGNSTDVDKVCWQGPANATGDTIYKFPNARPSGASGIPYFTDADPSQMGWYYIGTNLQAWDAQLDTWSGITPAANVGAFLAAPTSASFATMIASDLAVVDGGTGLSGGTEGGINWYSTATALASSALLTQYGVMIGGGVDAAPSTIGVGTDNQVLRGATGAAPAFGALVDADVPNTITIDLATAATTAGTVTTAAQPAITSVGALTGLTMAGIIADNDAMVFECDANDDGSEKFSFTNGTGTEVASITEAGIFSTNGYHVVGGASAGTDYTITINGQDSDITFEWGEDEVALNIDTDDNTNEEGLIIDLDTATDNEVEIATHASTATTQIDFTSLNLTTTGTITGGTITSSGIYDVTGATSLTLGSADVTSWILSGMSETLTLTPSADLVTVTTGTGVAAIDFSAINLVTTGTIKGALGTEKDDDSLAAAQCYGTAHWYSGGAETITLPAAVVGMNLMIYASDATIKHIDPNGTDTIILDGLELTAGYQIQNGTPVVGDFITLVCFTANKWTTLGKSGTWTTHGAD